MATTTTPVALTPASYTDLGAGPMYLSAGGGPVIYQICDSQPAASSGGNVQQPGEPPAPLSTTSHVWATCGAAGVVANVSAGTGITIGATGGGGGGSVTQGTSPWVVSVSGAVTLPTGAATAAKQPALGTAGSAAADVLSVQGIASMTALKVDNSAVTQPISPPVGAANFVTGQWSNATGSATLIAAARAGAVGTGRVSLTLYNTSSVTIYYGPSGVTSGNGTRLLPGASRTIYTTAAIYGVPASGTGTIDYDETF